MKIAVSALVFALWMSTNVVNAGPFQSRKNKAMTQEEFQAIAQSCGVSEGFQCAGVILACGGICYVSLGAGCATCAGSSYSTCVDCFSKLNEAKKQENSKIVNKEDFQAIVQSCGLANGIECGTKVVSCTATCYNNGITSSQCEDCFGDSYSTCKDCLSGEKEKENKKVVTIEDFEAIVQSCGWATGIQCGATVVSCTATCYNNGITSSQCVDCFGDSYSTCKDCLSEEKEKENKKVVTIEDFEAIVQSCGLATGIQCGATVVSCTATCYNNGITSSQCVDCFGDSYSTCKDCLSEEKKKDEQMIEKILEELVN